MLASCKALESLASKLKAAAALHECPVEASADLQRLLEARLPNNPALPSRHCSQR